MQRRFVKRYGIYFFYDQQGQVDTYVIHFLEHMLPHFSKTVVVVNGLLTKESRLQLSALPNVSIIVRENVGFDVWAYKTALDYWGWDELADCDELVMMNFTIMGPVNSFDDMFAEMSLRDVDFWGITVHNGADFDPWGQIPDGKIPIHLQSHFLAFRHNFVVSREFQAYWDDPPQIDSYEDSVSRHEVLFTERFSNQGFTWSVYVDTSDTQRLLHYPLFNSPVDLIANRNCPIFKRKTFLVAPDSYLSENSNGVAGDLLRYLRSSEKFDLELLVPHIARCAHASHLELSLNSYFFPGGLASENSPHRVGVVAISPSPTEVKLIIERMRGAGIVDLFVVDETGLIDVETSSRLADGGRGGGEVRVDVVSKVSLVLKRIENLDFAVFVSVSGPSLPFQEGVSLARARMVLDALLNGKNHVDAVLSTFERHPYLGVLGAPQPIHGSYFGDLGSEWGEHFPKVKDIAVAHKISVPISFDVSPAIGGGQSFWLRTRALSSSWQRDSHHQSLRPLATVGETSTASQEDNILLFLIPLLVQARGYLSGFFMNSEIAANVLSNSFHYMREMNRASSASRGHNFHEIRQSVINKKNHLKALTHREIQLSEEVSNLRNSKSWKVTWPLRAVLGFFRNR